MSQRKQRAARLAEAQTAPLPGSAASYTNLSPRHALRLPLAFTLILASFGLIPSVASQPRLLWSLSGAVVVLLLGSAWVFVAARRAGRTFSVDVVLRKQHYVQACAQLAVYIYWGWYWRQVYDSAHLIAAQIAFAYAFDMLLTWSRREHFVLGFGPFPIIFSINLFMWFKPDWFYLQFLMVAVGFAVKELVRWDKDGRRAHIFNPSSFPLGLFALLLIMTGTTDLTWGPEIAVTQIFPPYMYFVIFAVSLPAQLLFGVAAMTLSAVTTTYVFILVYFAVTGSHFFSPDALGGGAVPIAAFLGMHLLFNDPSTSPRTELGRVLFGMLYGLSIIGLFGLLGGLGIPTHYDKLLAVPVLNLLIKGIDQLARSDVLNRFDPARLGQALAPVRRNLGYVTVWALIFVVMQVQTGGEVALARGVSLLSQGHVDETIAHYRALARENPDNAVIQNELGYVLLRAGQLEEAEAPLAQARRIEPDIAQTHNSLGIVYAQTGRPAQAVAALTRAIALKPDYPEAQFNLAQLYDAGRGVDEDDVRAAELYRAAAEQGHVGAQVNLGRMYSDGRGVPQSDAEALAWYQSAADEGHPFAQFNLARMYASGAGVGRDDVTAYMWYNLAAGDLTGDERTLATEAAARLAQRMSPVEIADAHRRAEAWKPKGEIR